MASPAGSSSMRVRKPPPGGVRSGRPATKTAMTIQPGRSRPAASPCHSRRYEESSGHAQGRRGKDSRPRLRIGRRRPRGGRNRDNRACRRRTRGLELDYRKAVINICQVPGTRKLQGEAAVELVARRGPSQGLNSVFEFSLVGGRALLRTPEAVSPVLQAPVNRPEGTRPSVRVPLSAWTGRFAGR